MLQWLATLLCLSTSCSTTHSTLDLSKHKALLLSLVTQVKDDINDLYPMISLILGNDFQQKVAPLLESIGVFQAVQNHQQLRVPAVNPIKLLYHVFLIKLLAVASLGPSCIGVYDVQMTDQLLTSHTSCASHVILLVASGMKQQVEAFQKRLGALAEDRLCQHLITALTTAKIEELYVPIQILIYECYIIDNYTYTTCFTIMQFWNFLMFLFPVMNFVLISLCVYVQINCHHNN